MYKKVEAFGGSLRVSLSLSFLPLIPPPLRPSLAPPLHPEKPKITETFKLIGNKQETRDILKNDQEISYNKTRIVLNGMLKN